MHCLLRWIVAIVVVGGLAHGAAPVRAASPDELAFARLFIAAARAKPDFGPVDGTLRTDFASPDYDSTAFAGVFVADVAVRVRFVVPHAASDGDWSFFINLRSGMEPHYRLQVFSNGTWALVYDYDVDGGSPALASGTLSRLTTEVGATNTLQVVTDHKLGYVTVNGELLDTLPLDLVGAGAVSITARSNVPNEAARYADFTVWSDQDPSHPWMTGDDAVDFDTGSEVFAKAMETVAGTQPAFGPLDGELAVGNGDKIPLVAADGNVRNFVAHVEFAVPYDRKVGGWDVGVLLATPGPNDRPVEYRFMVVGSKRWDVLMGAGQAIQSGPLPFLPSAQGDLFSIDLVVIDASAYLAIDGRFVSRIPLPVNAKPGRLQIGATLYFQDVVAGTATPFSRFTVWGLGSGR